ncbi:LysR substrate-binding domain-containing protein [Bosea sp. BK604]|uniref:LysR substrate-binding domain-containing protein n=1 Tax=Bosea sp. BK604 TaxID=2512180 RepID=UPI00104AEC69|nr:LysR substrate-binding domain-containing protein [Bosea sp. BK604]TCR65371.1 DNA-binding transcriptional LysR family regulator [Bosea sp. BK604]
MARSLPPLSALKAFEATARLGSVGRAAREIGRTHGAVSRQLSALQQHAGVAMFEKKGTGLQLTPLGQAFQRTVAEAFDTLERGYRKLRDDARGASIHVACSATFAMRWLVPRLGNFYRAHPDILIRLSMSSPRDTREDDADIMLTWDRLASPIRDPDRAVSLADVAFGPVCAPGCAVAIEPGSFAMPSRIAHDYNPLAWKNWEALSGLRVTAASERTFPHTYLCIEAALAGIGVALVERHLVLSEIEQGKLLAPCGWASFPGGFAAIRLSDRAAQEPARAFIGWLKAELEQVDGDGERGREAT